MGRVYDAFVRSQHVSDVPDDTAVFQDDLTGVSKSHGLEGFVRSEEQPLANAARHNGGDTPVALTDGVARPGTLVNSPETDAISDRLVDVRQIADGIAFAGRAVRRHTLIVAAMFSLVLVATGGAVRLWPRTYHASARLLTERNDLMAALSNPGRAISDADMPTRAVSEMILGRRNLLSIVKRTRLQEGWDRTRPPLSRARDALLRSVFGYHQTEDEQLDGLVGLLEKQLKVSSTLEGMIFIDIDWRDARMAYELVEAALQSFLDLRRGREMSTITESISILERSAAALQIEIDGTSAALQATFPTGRQLVTKPKNSRPASPHVTDATLEATVPTPVERPIAPSEPETLVKLARLKGQIDSKREEIAKQEEARRQQLAELQAQLATGLTMYTERHPAVVNLRQSIAALSSEPRQLALLRDQVHNLEAQYVAASEPVPAQDSRPDPPTQSANASEPTPAEDQRTGGVSSESDGALSVAKPGATRASGDLTEPLNPLTLRLRLELAQLGNLRDRINGARIELAAAQASFESRYIVTRPVEVPRRPTKPNSAAILLAGALGAVILSVAAAVTADVVSPRVVDAWQLERQLGIQVLIRLKDW